MFVKGRFHAAAGGVGSILTPWANAQGARVIGVVSTPEKAKLAKEYGCWETILASEDVPARVKELTGHTARVLHLAVSPDGSMVASAGADETLRFWALFPHAPGSAGGGAGLDATASMQQVLESAPVQAHFQKVVDELAASSTGSASRASTSRSSVSAAYGVSAPTTMPWLASSSTSAGVSASTCAIAPASGAPGRRYGTHAQRT